MVRRLVRFLLCTLLAVWLGSLVMVLNGVVSLFAAYPRSTGSVVAIQGAPVLFAAYERVTIWVGTAAAVSAGVVGLMWTWQRWPKNLIAIGSTVALAMLMVSFVWLTPEINRLREAGLSQTPEFRSRHNLSNVLYLGQLGFVAVAFFSSLLLRDKPKQV